MLQAIALSGPLRWFNMHVHNTESGQELVSSQLLSLGVQRLTWWRRKLPHSCCGEGSCITHHRHACGAQPGAEDAQRGVGIDFEEVEVEVAVKEEVQAKELAAVLKGEEVKGSGGGCRKEILHSRPGIAKQRYNSMQYGLRNIA